ncbi:MAG TPA: hypothetical protein VNJ04_09465 [Gemmatimonadaceae bacterium]|nr:hypothetical protein [Gemmatimonadaceae bacterium]
MKTTWVSPAKQITGLDHLAVQAVSEHLFSEMLPGLTNVTPRVRCYSFYAWFVWAFDQREKKKTVSDLIHLFRRAECLHTLIGIYHELETGDEWLHGGGLVGRDVLVGAAEKIHAGGSVKLSHFAVLESDQGDRYFKHRLGGLGQYYLGPLKELLVLDGDSKRGLRYTEEWGATLAEIYERSVDRSAFFNAIEADRVDADVLKSLRAFCPCRLRSNQKEREALIELMFLQGKGALVQQFGEQRRASLLALLGYAKSVDTATPGAVDVDPFLSVAYSDPAPAKSKWVMPAELTPAMEAWGVYQRHELLSTAMQGLFWAGLSALLDEGGHASDTTAFSEWFADRFENALGPKPKQASFASFVGARLDSQPPLDDWQSAQHELSLSVALMDAQKQKKRDEVVSLALRILASLIARDAGRSGYGRFELTDRFLKTYEINLVSLRSHADGTWKDLSGRDWLKWLSGRWLLGIHLRVALRKLRHQTQDSFQIVPMEDGLWVRDNPPTARWSQPRLGSALRFLFDLGLLKLDEKAEGRPYLLSDEGAALLERELGKA